MLSNNELIGLFGSQITILIVTVTLNLRAYKRIGIIELGFSKNLSEIQLQLTNYVQTTNGAMLARIGIEQDEFRAKTSEVMLKLHEHMLYCERNFLSKPTFNMIIEQQSEERKEMKKELLDKLTELGKEIKGIK